MGVHKYLISIFALSCVCASSEPNLSEGSSCISDGVSGTCVSLYKCGSAAASQIYRDAGYGDDRIAKLPEKCGSEDKTPLVCCTDCDINKEGMFKNRVVGPGGIFLEKKGPKARDKCLDYFQSLPYSCRGKGNVKFEKQLNQKKKCHDYDLKVEPASGKQEDDSKEFPHMVLLGYGSEDQLKDVKWYCSGFIISERFIMTAGHCVDVDGIKAPTYARYAIKNRDDPIESWKVIKIKRSIQHPEFKRASPFNDIALLETETEFKFDQDVLPACLDVGEVEKNSVYLSGWGLLSIDDKPRKNLKVVKLEKVSEAECDKAYPKVGAYKLPLNHTIMMCYRNEDDKGVGSCLGDGGGPVQVIDQKCLYTAVGVTSHGRGCDQDPDLYTRVSAYIPWIESIVWS